MNGIISVAAVTAILVLAGAGLALTQRARFSWAWLLVAAGLVALNDAMLTRLYGHIPALLPHAAWNWQGKAMALAATLLVAGSPAFGWRRSGFTLRQAPGSLATALALSAAYALFFVVLAFVFPGGRSTPEEAAFQLTMPGLEEEPFYRGVLLLALDRAFPARVRLLGADWGWGAVLSCMMFGLAHAFGFAHGRFTFDLVTMALTGLPAFIAVWLRLRTGSLLLPVLLHNFGNSISLLV